MARVSDDTAEVEAVVPLPPEDFAVWALVMERDGYVRARRWLGRWRLRMTRRGDAALVLYGERGP